jgi:GNAT superfamily N-acetyltransferase
VSDGDATLALEWPAVITPEVLALAQRAAGEIASERGGAALLEALGHEEGELEAMANRGEIVVVRRDEAVVALAVVRERILCALFVDATARRQGVAREVVRSLLETPGAPRDAWALPGDRAMKSLYESIGWRARLLTMRGEP